MIKYFQQQLEYCKTFDYAMSQYLTQKLQKGGKKFFGKKIYFKTI